MNFTYLNMRPKPLHIYESRQLFIKSSRPCYKQTDKVISSSSAKSNIVRQGPLFRGLEVTLTLFRDLEGYEFTKLNAPLLASSGKGMSPAASKHFWLLFSRFYWFNFFFYLLTIYFWFYIMILRSQKFTLSFLFYWSENFLTKGFLMSCFVFINIHYIIMHLIISCNYYFRFYGKFSLKNSTNFIQ